MRDQGEVEEEKEESKGSYKELRQPYTKLEESPRVLENSDELLQEQQGKAILKNYEKLE